MTSLDWRDGLPYRPNIGVCLINREGLIWMGRAESVGPELVSEGCEWQMPQGGIDDDADIVAAAERELWEETGARSFELLGQTDNWWAYDFPIPSPDPDYKLAPFRGQKQKWVAFRFTGDDTEFDVSADHVDEPQEFFEWRWTRPEDVLDVTVNFKRSNYAKALEFFAEFLICK